MGTTKSRSFKTTKELSGKNGAKKWTTPMHHWGEILSQLSIIFATD
ncbi:MAG: hypothetical protein AAF900_01570 [Bacteroidota bacterium]